MNRKQHLWLLASLFMAVMALTACSSSDDTPDNPTPDTPTPGTTVTPTNMKMSALSGFVYDTNGNALSGVKVTSGTETFTTGADGGFVLNRVNSVGGRSMVRFSKSGYFDVLRSLTTADGAVWEVVMNEEYSENTARANFSASEGQQMEADDMEVTLQADGFKDDATGAAFDGYVEAKMLYLDPDDDNFGAMMPGGDLAAVRTDGSQAQLVSYGMTRVELSDYSRNKLQLADGKPATLTFPVPERFEGNTPAEIPLWSFNEQTGLWEEEGVATYDASRNVYVGTVTHFSWVNLDYPQSRATLRIVVKDQAGNAVPNLPIDLDGQRLVTTNLQGQAETYVPTQTAFYVSVHSENYGNYSPEVKIDVEAIATAGSTKTVNIVLPTLAHLSGRITNTGVGSNMATLWIEYSGKSTKKVHSDTNGLFYMNAPVGYKGEATLKVRANDGTLKSFDITLDGKDHAYDLSIATTAESGGQAVFTAKSDGKEYKFTVPNINYESLNGVSLIDDHLTVSGDNGEGYYDSGSSYNVTFDKYTEGQSAYNDVYFSFNEYSGDNYFNCSAFSPNNQPKDNKLTVTKESNGNYRFQLEGDAWLNTNDLQPANLANATVKANFTAPLLLRGKNLGRTTTKRADFPSFTPWLNGKVAEGALQITESTKLGKGILLWYFDESLGYSDYLNLKQQAQSALGDPVYSYDENEGDIAMAYFLKGGKFIMVSFCPWREKYNENDEIEMELDIYALRENHAARIQVHVLEGLNIDYNLLMGHKFRSAAAAPANYRPVWQRMK